MSVGVIIHTIHEIQASSFSITRKIDPKASFDISTV